MSSVPCWLTPKVTTGQIYWGAVPFVLIQCFMVGLIIAFPDLVSGGMAKKAAVNTDQIRIEVPAEEPDANAPLEAEEQDKTEPGDKK